MKKKNISLEEKYEEFWIYILLLTTLVIFLSSLKSYTFRLMGVELTYAVLFLPLIYFVANYITKMFDYKKTVAAIAISGVMSICFLAIVSFAMGKNLILTKHSADFCGYVVSQFFNLTLYQFLVSNKKNTLINLFIVNLLSLIIFYFFYSLINIKDISYGKYWLGYGLTIVIQGIICIPLTILDFKIKKKENKKLKN